MTRPLLIFLLIVFVARALWRLFDGVIEGAARPPRGSVAPPDGVKMQRDPVCGTFVVPRDALTLANGKERLYFCSAACRDAYRAKIA
jgi:hypothetical protein